jgi:hypothetical protein
MGLNMLRPCCSMARRVHIVMTVNIFMQDIAMFPERGGANGTIRLELSHKANMGETND